MKKIILDTDMGPDCDDAGALAILNRLADVGLLEMLCITHCTSDIFGAVTIDAINAYYGRKVPVGQLYKTDYISTIGPKNYTLIVAEKFLDGKEADTYEDALSLLRRTLAQNREVELLCIGPFINISDLLLSKPDQHSPLNGVQLVKNSVSRIVAMAGDFAGNEAEWNVKVDVASAQNVVALSPVPIIFCGFETGSDIITGQSLLRDTENPVHTAYKIFTKGSFLRPSFDLVTAYYAIKDDEGLFAMKDNITISISDEGITTAKEGGNHGYLINQKPPEEIAKVLEGWMGRV